MTRRGTTLLELLVALCLLTGVAVGLAGLGAIAARAAERAGDDGAWLSACAAFAAELRQRAAEASAIPHLGAQLDLRTRAGPGPVRVEPAAVSIRAAAFEDASPTPTDPEPVAWRYVFERDTGVVVVRLEPASSRRSAEPARRVLEGVRSFVASPTPRGDGFVVEVVGACGRAVIAVEMP